MKSSWPRREEGGGEGVPRLEAGQMLHRILLPGSPRDDGWRHQEKSQERRSYVQRHEATRVQASGETWAEMSMVCIPAPAWPLGSWDPALHPGTPSLAQCSPDHADVTAPHSRTVTVTGYILISRQRKNFLIFACAQTLCARVCLQLEVPSTIPLAPQVSYP